MRAENVGFQHSLYATDNHGVWTQQPVPRTTVDPFVNGYEAELPAALDALEGSTGPSWEQWLRALVPYIASLFVRGRDFTSEFRQRPLLQAVGDEFNTDSNANSARILEFNRLLAPVMCARWVVLRRMGGESFVLNDRGFVVTTDPRSGDVGWACPIGPDTMIGIFPEEVTPLVIRVNGIWFPALERVNLDAAESARFNDAMARTASSEVFGRDKAVIDRLLPAIGSQSEGAERSNGLWPFSHRARVAHDRDWHRLVSALHANPRDGALDLQSFDPEALAAGWCPPLIMTLNMREFRTGLFQEDDTVWGVMTEPPDYDEHFVRNLEGDSSASPAE